MKSLLLVHRRVQVLLVLFVKNIHLLAFHQNTQSTCFNVNGTCYKCKSERGSACGERMALEGNFNPSNVGWWYTEVDCATGIEKTKR